MKRIPLKKKFTPELNAAFLYVGIYLFWSALWILFSDRLLLTMTHDPNTLSRLQTYKGWFFVLVTGGILFALLRHGFALRYQRENALKKSATRLNHERQALQNVIDATQAGTWMWNIQTGALNVNKTWADALGYTDKEIANLNFPAWEKMVHPDDLQTSIAALRDHQDKKTEIYIAEFRMRHKNGQWIWIKDRGKIIEWDANNQPLIMIGTHHDITATKEAERQLHITQKCMDQSAIAIFQIEDDSGRIIYVNHWASAYLGYSRDELTTMTVYDIDVNFSQESWLKKRRSILESKKHGTFETRHRCKDSTVVPVEVTITYVDIDGVPTAFTFVNDISQRKAMEADLIQKHKMEAIGLLSGGIAHNFNNSLAIVMGNLELAQNKLTNPGALERHLTNAQTAALRSRDLINQLATFSHKQETGIRQFNLSVIVEETLRLLHSTNPSTIDLTFEMAPIARDTLLVNGDPGRVQEVLLNLYSNARDAIGGQQGNIRIELQKKHLTEADLKGHKPVQSGEYAIIKIRDDGCGMDHETIDKIFTPFFTTKNPEQGTGMGLATVADIISQHRGFTEINSQPKVGTEFFIFLPVLETRKDKEVPLSESKTQANEAGKKRKILFVDDEEMIRGIAVEFLSELGYQADTSTDGHAALERLKNNPTEFDLVITDQTMPGLIGTDLAKEVWKINANLPVILCSGYYQGPDKIAQKEQNNITAFCPKPLRLNELSNVVHGALNPEENTRQEPS